MRYVISRGTDAERSSEARARQLASALRFGDLWFEASEDDETDAARGVGAEPSRLARSATDAAVGSVARERLHLVVQKGDLFRRHCPQVPILLDAGRYLVADMSPDEAASRAAEGSQCFSIRPLPVSGSVFERRSRAARSSELPWVRAAADGVSRAFFEARLRELVAFPTRLSTSEFFLQAAELARSQLGQLGFETRLEEIAVHGKSSVNVIAERPGRGAAARDVLIACAHLDSINQHGSSTTPAPGADDNASGSAGLLTIAHAFREQQSKHDLRLILWGGEEQGLFGSRQYVASLPAGERQRIAAVVNMDMIGVLNTPSPSVLLEGAALSQSIIDSLADAAALYTSLEVRTSLNPFNSDHVSFIDAQIPAVLTIEGDDSGNPHVHSAADTLDRIDVGLAVEILRMNVACLAERLGQP